MSLASDEIYPDSEQILVAKPSVEQEDLRGHPEIDPLGGYSTAHLFEEIVVRGVEIRLAKEVSEYPQTLFDHFAKVSDARSKSWVSTGTRDLSVLERAAELAGETGETVNIAKKLLRAELGMLGNYKPGDTTVEELVGKLEYEMGDVFICLLNLQNKVPGVDLLRGFRRAFNEKSEQLGFPERV